MKERDNEFEFGGIRVVPEKELVEVEAGCPDGAEACMGGTIHMCIFPNQWVDLKETC
jgi:hypothetical protein